MCVLRFQTCNVRQLLFCSSDLKNPPGSTQLQLEENNVFIAQRCHMELKKKEKDLAKYP